VPVRPSGRDDHRVSKHCLSEEVDRDHIYGLIIFEGLLHELKESGCRFFDRPILGFYEGSLLLLLVLFTH
jgi:hypothetical protein